MTWQSSAYLICCQLWNQDIAAFGLSHRHFSPKSTKHGLKWELECLSTYRISENHPMFCSFSVPWPWSSLVWARKFFSFRHENFWKFIIFDLHRQYVHQMKAENILNSNLTSKNTICYKKKSKFFFSKFLLQFRQKFIFSNSNFSKIFFTTPKNYFLHLF